MDIAPEDDDDFAEYRQHIERIANAVKRIDELGHSTSAMRQVSECLDWFAYLTREHFGLQSRVLQHCSQHSDYLVERSAVFVEYRRKLAGLYIDATRQDGSVPDRLKSLCHDVLDDIQAQHSVFIELMRRNMGDLQLRQTPRIDPVVRSPTWDGPENAVPMSA